MQPPVLDAAFARAFAQEWVDAWNSHDLERILAHYTDDFEMSSPYIAEWGFSPTGTLHGKDAIRAYWSKGLAAPLPIRFELIDAYAGVGGLVIHYKSVGRRFVTEVLAFDAERRHAIRGAAYYGAPATA